MAPSTVSSYAYGSGGGFETWLWYTTDAVEPPVMHTLNTPRTLARCLSPLLCLLSTIACDRVAGTSATPALLATPTSVRPANSPAPLVTPSAAGTPVGNDNLKVARPTVRQEVKSPISVQGQARVFEANVQIALKDKGGQTLASSFTTASKGAPDWGDYKADLPFRVTVQQEATLEVFALNARDGSPQFVVAVPVTLLPN